MRQLAFALLLGCGDNVVVPSPPPDRVEVALVPAAPANGLDVLFVVQDSCCVLDKQIQLKAAFPQFLDELARATPGGLPSLHIGVVSTDLGTSSLDDAQPAPAFGNGPGSCSGSGKAGNLQTNGTALVNGSFISDIKNADGTRSMNYTGPLTDAFAAIASLGAGGCAFEQPLRAAELALSDPTKNPGFVRADAALAVIFLAEDEDCSVASTGLFDPDTSQLGPFSTFRCIRYGVTCDVDGATPEEISVPGLKSECHANDQSAYIMSVTPYVERMQRLADSRQMVVAAIAGPTSPYEVELVTPPGGGTPGPFLGTSCPEAASDARIVAQAAPRLAQATMAFRRHVYASSCDSDYGASMSTIARVLAEPLGNTCLREPIKQPADCEVADELDDGTRLTLPECSAGPSDACYTLVEDSSCAASNLRIEVVRATDPPVDSMISVRCYGW